MRPLKSLALPTLTLLTALAAGILLLLYIALGCGQSAHFIC